MMIQRETNKKINLIFLIGKLFHVKAWKTLKSHREKKKITIKEFLHLVSYWGNRKTTKKKYKRGSVHYIILP